MQKTLSILNMLITHLPEIKEALGERWLDFVSKMRAQATSFENLTDETALIDAANQLLGIFVLDETVVEVITRPTHTKESITTTRHYLDHRVPPQSIDLQTVANRFYMLCQEPDKVIELAQTDLKDKPWTLIN